jgi:hypothetical protein
MGLGLGRAPESAALAEATAELRLTNLCRLRRAEQCAVSAYAETPARHGPRRYPDHGPFDR